MTLKVKLKHIDDSTPYGYPTKSIELRTRSGVITTPTRAVTSYEYNQKALVPSDAPLDDKIGLFFGRYGGDRLTKFLTEDEPFGSLCNRLRIHKERSYSHLNIALIKPVISEKHKDLFNSTEKRETFYRRVILAQSQAGYNTIAISIPKISTADVKQMMNDINRMLEKQNALPMFFFELDKRFSQLLSYAVNDLNQQLIGLYYKRDSPNAYDAIRQYHDRDIAFMVANATRLDRRYNNISTGHYMPFLSNDIFATAVPSPVIPKNTDEKVDPIEKNKNRLSGLLLFNKKNVSLHNMINKKFKTKQLLEEMKCSDDSLLHQMLDNFEEAGETSDDVKINRLAAFTRVHESKASYSELTEFAKRVAEGGSYEYIREDGKKSLKSAISHLQTKN